MSIVCDTHNEALWLFNQGYKPVRLSRRQKKPVEAGWTKRIHDAASIRAEFQNGENVGILLGEPAGWVVDVDLDNMDAVMAALEILPRTACFGRKSRPQSHYLFKVEGARNQVWEDAEGRHIVNLRSTGNQTMMPGSIHPSGERVEWVESGPMVALSASALIGLLDSIALRCGWTRPEERPSLDERLVRILRPTSNGAGYGRAALDDELSTLAGTREGGRNDQLNKSAFAIAQLVQAGELDSSALEEVRTAGLSTGLSRYEVDSTMKSAIAAAEKNPRAPRENRPMTHEPAPKPTREAVHAESTGVVEDLMRELAGTQGREQGGIAVPGFPWLTDALFGLSGTCLFTGPSGMGKTTLVANIAMGVAEAGEVPVVFVTAEMTRIEVAESMLAARAPIAVRDLRIGTMGGARGGEGLSRELMLTAGARASVERAAQELNRLIDTAALSILEARALVRPWTKLTGEHALSGVSDAVEALHPGRPVLVIVDTLATLDIRPARGESHRTDLDADADIVDALVAWRAALPAGSCILCIHEENKSMTGSGDGHSARGSSRYLYSCTQRINLVAADSPGGTRSLELRDHEAVEGIRELDIVVAKARRGGRAGSVVAVDFNWSTGTFKELMLFSPQQIADVKPSKRGGR